MTSLSIRFRMSRDSIVLVLNYYTSQDSEMSVPRHQLYSTISLRILAIILLTSRVTTADYWSALRPPALRRNSPSHSWGQMHTRISTSVESPCTATVLCSESMTDKGHRSAILVSCDAVAIPDHVRDKTREQVAKTLARFSGEQDHSQRHPHSYRPVMTEGSTRSRRTE